MCHTEWDIKSSGTTIQTDQPIQAARKFGINKKINKKIKNQARQWV